MAAFPLFITRLESTRDLMDCGWRKKRIEVVGEISLHTSIHGLDDEFYMQFLKNYFLKPKI